MTTDTLHGMLERIAECCEVCADDLQPIADQLQAVVERMEHDKDFSSLLAPQGALSGMTSVIYVSKEIGDKCPCKPGCVPCQLQRILGAPK